MSIEIKLKRKYRDPALRAIGGNKGSYRSRTGPNCCNAGCISNRRKKGRRKGANKAAMAQRKALVASMKAFQAGKLPPEVSS